MTCFAIFDVKATPKCDIYSDPLPTGATARLGTIRLRHDRLCAFAATQGGILRTIGGDGSIREWNITDGALIKVVKPENIRKTTPSAISSDGRLVAGTGGSDVSVWDAATGKQLAWSKPETIPVGVPRFSPDGTLLVFCDQYRSHILVFNWLTGAEQTLPIPKSKDKISRPFNPQMPGACLCNLSPDNRNLVVANAAQGILSVVNLTDQKEVYRLEGPCSGVAVSPDCKTLAVCWPVKEKGVVALHDFATGKVRDRYELGVPPAEPVFSPDSRFIACGNGLNAGVVLEVATGRTLHSFSEQPYPLIYSAEGKALIGKVGGQYLQVWDIKTGRAKFNRTC